MRARVRAELDAAFVQRSELLHRKEAASAKRCCLAPIVDRAEATSDGEDGGAEAVAPEDRGCDLAVVGEAVVDREHRCSRRQLPALTKRPCELIVQKHVEPQQ